MNAFPDECPIRTERRRLEVSARAFAIMAGVSVPLMYSLELGQPSVVNPKVLILFERMGVSPADLVKAYADYRRSLAQEVFRVANSSRVCRPKR